MYFSEIWTKLGLLNVGTLTMEAILDPPLQSDLHVWTNFLLGVTVQLGETPTSEQAVDSAQAVADPGFPWGGGANPVGRCQHVILPKFPKNSMKLKEFGPWRGCAAKVLLCRSATDKGSIWPMWLSGNDLYSGYDTGPERPQLQCAKRLDRDKQCFANSLFTVNIKIKSS